MNYKQGRLNVSTPFINDAFFQRSCRKNTAKFDPFVAFISQQHGSVGLGINHRTGGPARRGWLSCKQVRSLV